MVENGAIPMHRRPWLARQDRLLQIVIREGTHTGSILKVGGSRCQACRLGPLAISIEAVTGRTMTAIDVLANGYLILFFGRCCQTQRIGAYHGDRSQDYLEKKRISIVHSVAPVHAFRPFCHSSSLLLKVTNLRIYPPSLYWG